MGNKERAEDLGVEQSRAEQIRAEQIRVKQNRALIRSFLQVKSIGKNCPR